MREKHFCIVHAGQPEEVVLAHLAQLFAVRVLEHGRVDLQQAVLFNGPLQPLADVVLGPQWRVCRKAQEERGSWLTSQRLNREQMKVGRAWYLTVWEMNKLETECVSAAAAAAAAAYNIFYLIHARWKGFEQVENIWFQVNNLLGVLFIHCSSPSWSNTTVTMCRVRGGLLCRSDLSASSRWDDLDSWPAHQRVQLFSFLHFWWSLFHRKSNMGNICITLNTWLTTEMTKIE